MTAAYQLYNRAPVGSLLKRPGADRRKARNRFGRTPRVLDPPHLAAIRQCPCLKCGMDPAGEAAHVRTNSAAFGKRTGLGERPDDRHALPLCASCHRLDPDSQHRIGEATFWHQVGLNPLLVCEALHRASGDLVAMRAVVFRFVGERGKP